VKYEYLTAVICKGGKDEQHVSVEMDRYGRNGWEFCAWVHDWQFSAGPGPDRREALFKRVLTSE
jgi:hypothetical protein